MCFGWGRQRSWTRISWPRVNSCRLWKGNTATSSRNTIRPRRNWLPIVASSNALTTCYKHPLTHPHAVPFKIASPSVPDNNYLSKQIAISMMGYEQLHELLRPVFQVYVSVLLIESCYLSVYSTDTGFPNRLKLIETLWIHLFWQFIDRLGFLFGNGIDLLSFQL